MQLTIGKKIALGFTALLGLVLLVVIVSLAGLASTAGKFNSLLQNAAAMETHATVSRVALLESRRYEKDLLYADDASMVTKVRGFTSALHDELTKVKQLGAATHAEELEGGAGELLNLADRYQQGIDDMLRAPIGQERMLAALPMRKIAAQLESGQTALLAKIHAHIEQESGATYASVSLIQRASAVLGLLVLIGGGVIGIFLARSITRPLQDAVRAASRIAKGDLSHDITARGHDEVAQLMHAMRDMQAQLRDMIAKLQRNANNVGDMSQTLAASVSQISVNVGRESQAMGSMATAIEEMSRSTTLISDQGSNARTIASAARNLADSGATVVDQMVAGLQQAAREMVEASREVTQLGDDASRIGDVVQVIKDIADQTNLLALNAAIEAARAGDQGRGFAVVADEVRKLAERTGAATLEINQMSTRIGSVVTAALQSMDRVMSSTRQGVTDANTAQESITSLRNSFTEVATVIDEISTALKAQNLASAELARNTDQVARMSGDNSSAAQGLLGMTRDLAGNAGEVRAAFGAFRV